MLSVEAARQQMLDTIGVLPTEQRAILECSGYVLAKDLYASENIPPFDNSAMDGFAVLSSDVKDASKENPIVLSVGGNYRCGICARKTGIIRECGTYHDRCDDARRCRRSRYARGNRV